MSHARELLEQQAPELEVEGEMHGDAALSESLRLQAFPASRLKGEANLLIMPNLDAANIAYNLLKITGGRRYYHRLHPAGGKQVGAYPDLHRDSETYREHECTGSSRRKKTLKGRQ